MTAAINQAEDHREAAWGYAAHGEPRWPAELAVLAALLLYVTLPARLTLGPVWVVPALELALLIPLALTARHRLHGEAAWRRYAAIALIAIINAANLASLILLVHYLLVPGTKATGRELLFSSIEIWLTNLIIFALWYWELDRGGPAARTHPKHPCPDFLFPQMVTPASAPAGWSPSFADYLYLAFTCATALSPADVMPLTPWAKTLMLVEALISLLTVVLVAARAVNILG